MRRRASPFVELRRSEPGDTVIGERFGRYRIVAPIAWGGMSQVWKAEDELRSSPVALKLLAAHLLGSVTERKRFLGEARTVMSLSHPGIVNVLEVGERESQPWMAMSYVDGETPPRGSFTSRA